MQTYFIVAAVIFALALFSGKTSICFFPFSIHIERPFYTIGHLLIIIGIICYMYDDFKKKETTIPKPKIAVNLSEANTLFTKHNTNDAFIQWKGTDVCMDFRCNCGWHNHYDAYFAYEVECFQCGEVYAPSCNVEMIRLLDHSSMPVQSREAEELES